MFSFGSTAVHTSRRHAATAPLHPLAARNALILITMPIGRYSLAPAGHPQQHFTLYTSAAHLPRPTSTRLPPSSGCSPSSAPSGLPDPRGRSSTRCSLPLNHDLPARSRPPAATPSTATTGCTAPHKPPSAAAPPYAPARCQWPALLSPTHAASRCPPSAAHASRQSAAATLASPRMSAFDG